MKLFAAALIVRCVIGAFEYRENHPASLSHQLCAVSDTAPLSNLSNPAYLPIWKGIYFSSAYGKPYLLREMNAANIRTGYSTGGFGIQGGWSFFGINEYQEHVLELDFGRRIFPFLFIGGGVSNYRLIINTPDISLHESLFNYRLALLLVPFKWMHISYLQENVQSFFDKKRQDLMYPQWSAGISLNPVNGVFFIWNITSAYYGYINSFAVSTNLLSCLNFKAGYSREISTCSFAVNFFYKSMGISYGIDYHAFLGSTHRIAVTLSTEDLRLEEIQYLKKRLTGKPRRSGLPAIDINKCSIEELETIPVLTKEMAGRIIKYREMIGPITIKALFQIGLDSKQLKEIQEYIHGLSLDENDDDNARAGKKYIRNRNNKNGFATLEKRKELFKKLLQTGLPSGMALRIAELSREKNRDELAREIENMAEIPRSMKVEIRRICDESL